jgi:outer membrane receptor protein involved in Fe transport
LRTSGAIFRACALLFAATTSTVRGDDPTAETTTAEVVTPADAATTRLSEVVVEAKRPVSAASSDEVRASDYALRPHATTIEILNNIPGLVVAQHQGGGKAPQWLIRGFDADHGTDIAVFVDGEPVNLVSHAHGQGYTDLNFLIPETVERFQLYKGPYFVQFGDFDTAGAINFVTRDEVEESFALAEGGSFDLQRYVAVASPRLSWAKTLLAAQVRFFDGPFINPEHFHQYNGFAKLVANPTLDSRLSLSGSVYAGGWHGSGQIPRREVRAGQLDRFGSIDPSEGSRGTDREDLDLHYDYTPNASDSWSFQAYGKRYKLSLFSDFTFFKDTGLRFVGEPDGSVLDTRDGPVIANANYIPGDEIEQNDQRYLHGVKSRYTHYWLLQDRPIESQLGFENRNDSVNVALHRAVRRVRFFAINKLHVNEHSFAGFMQHQIFLTDWIRFEAGLRGDLFIFDGQDRLPQQGADPNFTPVPIYGYTTAGIVSPKANLIVTAAPSTDVFFNFGTGYHSNDARNALLGQDSGFSPLSRATAWEVGARTRQFDRLDLAAGFWFLDLDSELVFSGDAGNQETGAGGTLQPAGPTRRYGVDFEARCQITDWLYSDFDLSYAHARFRNGDYVPLAPWLLVNGGLTADFRNGLSIALRSRYLASRPAIEDGSLTADGYKLFDLIGKYRWRNVEASLALLNITDAEWQEATFSDNSCVRSEVGTATGCVAHPGQQDDHPVDAQSDIHFTPGNPFGVRGGVTIYY